MGKDDILRFRERVCVRRSRVLRKMLLDEGHKSRLSIHLGMTKMYKDLKATFWVDGYKDRCGRLCCFMLGMSKSED